MKQQENEFIVKKHIFQKIIITGKTFNGKKKSFFFKIVAYKENPTGQIIWYNFYGICC